MAVVLADVFADEVPYLLIPLFELHPLFAGLLIKVPLLLLLYDALEIAPLDVVALPLHDVVALELVTPVDHGEVRVLLAAAAEPLNHVTPLAPVLSLTQGLHMLLVALPAA